MSSRPSTHHYFLDEAGDTAFFGKGRLPVIGQAGVSLGFSIGMVRFQGDLRKIRGQVVTAQRAVEVDRYLNALPSVRKKMAGGGFFFHATDDPPEVRALFFRLMDTLDCTCEVVMARKIPALFAAKHHARDGEFYADVLSHLLKDKLALGQRVVLNIAERGTSTRNANLGQALGRASDHHRREQAGVAVSSAVVFNVQNHSTEPLLNIADYFCWAVQRVFERGDMRHYEFLSGKITRIEDLYAAPDGLRIYGPSRPLSGINQLGPPSP